MLLTANLVLKGVVVVFISYMFEEGGRTAKSSPSSLQLKLNSDLLTAIIRKYAFFTPLFCLVSLFSSSSSSSLSSRLFRFSVNLSGARLINAFMYVPIFFGVDGG